MLDCNCLLLWNSARILSFTLWLGVNYMVSPRIFSQEWKKFLLYMKKTWEWGHQSNELNSRSECQCPAFVENNVCGFFSAVSGEKNWKWGAYLNCLERPKELLFRGLHQVQVVGSAVMSQTCFTSNISLPSAYGATRMLHCQHCRKL